MKRKRIADPGSSERALCTFFAADARRGAWTVYPEQGNWDLLLVRRGVQVGIQAKLIGGVEVILQALPSLNGQARYHRPEVQTGPTYRAILVARFPGRTPRAERRRREEVYELARHLRLIVLEPPEPPFRTSGWCRVGWHDNLSRSILSCGTSLDFRYYRHRPEAPVWTPPFVPDLPAGVPSPRTVSPWMIAAVKLELRTRDRGWACLDDARAETRAIGGDWNPGTLLSRYFVCHGKRIPGSRQFKWFPRTHSIPSAAFPEVAAELMAVKPGEEVR